MALVSKMRLLEKGDIYFKLYQFSDINDPLQLIFVAGIGILIVFIVVSTVVSMLTTWRSWLYKSGEGFQIVDRIHNYYMKQDWQSHFGQ